MKKNYVVWARVSSREQAREGHSLTGQVADLTKYAAQNDGTVVKVFQATETASVQKLRRSFQDMVGFVRSNAHLLAGVLMMSIDRASRNKFDWVDLCRLETETGVRLIFISQQTEDNPSGNLIRNIHAVMAEHYSEALKQNICLGQTRRVEAGLCLGLAPYGLANVKRNGRREIDLDPVEADKVRLIFSLFSSGRFSVKSLTAELARQGVSYSDTNTKFNKSKLYALLTSRVYIGEVFRQGKWYPGTFPRLIDQVTFNRVQQILRGPGRTSHELVYASGLIRCGFCGHMFTGEEPVKNRGRPNEKRYRYYRCTEQTTTPGHLDEWRFTEAELDQQVLALLSKLKIADADYREWFVQVIRARAGQDQDAAKKHLTELKRQHTRLTAEHSRLVDMRLTGDIDAEDFAKKKTEYRDRLAQLTEQMTAADDSSANSGDLAVKVVELSQDLVRRWLAADFTAKRTILEMIGSNYWTEGAKLCVTMNKPFDVIAEGLIQEKVEAPGIEPGGSPFPRNDLS